jgi:threonine aldolase
MDNLNKLLVLESLQKIIEEVQATIENLRKKREDRKIIRKELYQAINKKYKLSIPIKNYDSSDDRYWLSEEHHEQMAKKLAQIVVKNTKQESQEHQKNITKVILEIPKNSKKSKQNTGGVAKLFKDIEKKLDLDK